MHLHQLWHDYRCNVNLHSRLVLLPTTCDIYGMEQDGEVIGGIFFIAVFVIGGTLLCLFIWCGPPNCCKKIQSCLSCKTEQREHVTMIPSQREMEYVKITSSPDGPAATYYTLEWTLHVDDVDFYVPVMAFCLMYKKVEVMPDMVDGQYRLRRHLETSFHVFEDLPEQTRQYTFSFLDPDTYYEVKVTALYRTNQRKTKTFIFKTSDVDPPDTQEAVTVTPQTEHVTFAEINYLSLQNSFSSDETDVIDSDVPEDQLTDSRNSYLSVHSYSDLPPSYEDLPPSYQDVMRTFL